MKWSDTRYLAEADVAFIFTDYESFGTMSSWVGTYFNSTVQFIVFTISERLPDAKTYRSGIVGEI